MKAILAFATLLTLGFGQPAYLGLSTWTQSHVIGLSGGGYLMQGHNDFRNAAMLIKAKRHIKFDVIKYPAGISSQSVAGAAQIKNHHFGLRLSRIAYGIFEGRSVDNVKTEDYSASDIHIQGGYAVRSNSGKFNFGFNSGLFLSRLDSDKANVFTLSPSIIYHGNLLSLSMAAQNYGRVMKYYGRTKESLNGSIITSISRSLESLPIELEIDYVYSGKVKNLIILSGTYSIANGITIQGGASSNKSDLMTDISFVKNVFSDFGFGVGYRAGEVNLDMNIYSYGPSGMVFSMGMAIFY